VNDKTIREIADAMVSSGMRDAGYVYINIDDTWEGRRDEAGHIQPNGTGRPIVLSLCEYGWEAVWRWGAGTGGNLWRPTGRHAGAYVVPLHDGVTIVTLR